MTPSKIMSDIVDSAVGAKTHFDIWWAQASEAPLQKRDRPTHDHWDFFSASQDAHYTAFFIYFARLFDRRTDSSSLPTYLKLLHPDEQLRLAEPVWQEFSALAVRAVPLVTVRHKTVAHVEAALTEKDVFAPLNITWNEIRAILSDTIDFVVRLRGVQHQGQIGIPREGRMREATFGLLDALSKASVA